jgi:hypothetical protein
VNHLPRAADEVRRIVRASRCHVWISLFDKEEERCISSNARNLSFTSSAFIAAAD